MIEKPQLTVPARITLAVVHRPLTRLRLPARWVNAAAAVAYGGLYRSVLLWLRVTLPLRRRGWL
jgi:hypothetical protein